MVLESKTGVIKKVGALFEVPSFGEVSINIDRHTCENSQTCEVRMRVFNCK